VAWSDRMEKSGYPSFFKAVPEKPSYYKKE
jgi:hypothetical protein